MIMNCAFLTQTQALKTSDVILDVNGRSFEAAVFMGNRDFVFELKIGTLLYMYNTLSP